MAIIYNVVNWCILDESSFMQAIVDFAWEHPVNK